MGIVWQGRDELLDRDVAVKQIALPPMASDAEERLSYQRTLREARTAARLNHPSVITVFDVVEEDGMPWIVMELIRARPLDQVIAEDGPLTPAQAAQLGLSLLDALSSAHAAGVLHRDVKPSNVLISPEGKAILTDFGIATVQGEPGMTQAGMIAGTPGFAPPERVRGADATPASDLWSLGATLYAAVEGRGPFDRAGGSAAIVASIATEPAPKAPSAGPLASVIDMLLRTDAAERPDAAAARRMLRTAWVDARHGGYLGAGLRAFSQREPDRPVAVAEPPPDAVGLDATTATQVVIVPAAVAGAGKSATANAEAAGVGVSVAVRAGDSAGPVADARAGSASAGTGMPAVAATDVVPDLMATPVFAELKMPDAGESADADGDKPDQGGSTSGSTSGPPWPPRPSGNLAGLLRSRRGLVITAPLAASALVAGIVFLAFPGYNNLLGGGREHPPSASQVSSGAAQSGGLGTKHHHGKTPARAGGSGNSPGGQPSGAPRPVRHHGSRSPGSPGPSAKPSPSGQPTPKSPSATPSPSPTPTTSSPQPSGPELPAGYSWFQVTTSQSGTTAGFRLGAPSSCLLTPGLHAVIKSSVGNIKLMVDMAAFAVANPVREAKRLQAAAITHSKYRSYHLVSITPRSFHGWAAATWTFWWKPTSTTRRDVSKIIFTAQTSAGPQPYVLTMSAPARLVASATKVFNVAKSTFRPLPG
jgi:eukaryotic-like serine/threonine-protein kinase